MDNPLTGTFFDDTAKQRLKGVDRLLEPLKLGQALPASQMAQDLGLDENATEQLKQLYYVYYSEDPAFWQDVSATTLTIQEFLPVLMAHTPENQQAQLSQLANTIEDSSGTGFSASEMAGIFNISQDEALQLFGMVLAPDRPITLPVFTKFLVEKVLTNTAYAGFFTEQQSQQLIALNEIVQLAASGTELSVSQTGTLFNIDENMVNTVFRLYHGAQNIAGKTMSLEEIIGFILTDTAIRESVDDQKVQQLTQLNALIQAAVNEISLTHTELSALTGMDAGDLKLLLHIMKHKKEV